MYQNDRIGYYSNNTVAYIIPEYVLNEDETESSLQVFYSRAEKILSTVDDSMTDLQKALTVHDYICNYAIYPANINDEGVDKEIYHSAYGFLYDNVAVCAGYTLTFS